MIRGAGDDGWEMRKVVVIMCNTENECGWGSDFDDTKKKK
jgi:hypothetical protein